MTTTSRPAHANRSTHPRRRPVGQALLALVLALLGGLALVSPGSAVAAPPPSPDLGPNVLVFDPSMSVAQIQASADAVYTQQVDNEMGTARYTLLFKPGTYGTPQAPLMLKVGYYTEVAGLGALPTDVVINGHVDVYNRCLTPTNCIALVNFWRSLSNLTINVMGESGCRSSGNFWAVSQAAPMRRVNIVGNLTLMDYCTAGPQYASGGFIADSRLNSVVNGSQQQFLVRNGSVGSWSNAVWNQVFSGVQGAPANSFPNPQYTTLATTPLSRERPFLFIDGSGRWQVRVPSATSDSSGVTWASGQTPGRTIPLSDFYIARPTDSVVTINSQLARGKHLLLTPGVYTADRSITVKRANTVVLAMGLASITASGGAVPLVIGDVPGVIVAGLIVDAGPVSSPALIRVGSRQPQDEPVRTSASNPTTLQDVFLRVGGPFAGRATVGLEVNLDHTLLDDIWAWRADHGNGVGWTVNPAENGVVVNGDDVTATGLFSEHFRQYDTVWNGERGRTVFYQNELPYDPPNQAAWQHDGVLGWAGYKVGDRVRTHELWGGGVYIFTNVDPTIHASRGFEVPVTPGVRLHDIITVNLSAGTIDHVVHDTGDPVSNAAIGVPSYVVSYP